MGHLQMTGKLEREELCAVDGACLTWKGTPCKEDEEGNEPD